MRDTEATFHKFISGSSKFSYSTSSTAQGGGGSFKNRKPIGEVGCCESRMAVFYGVVAMVAVVTSPQLLDVVWCSAVVVLSCSCNVV